MTLPWRDPRSAAACALRALPPGRDAAAVDRLTDLLLAGLAR
ncbi:hypothetical protein AB0K12_30825 [Nonomuraea sp. NPDC049419]